MEPKKMNHRIAPLLMCMSMMGSAALAQPMMKISGYVNAPEFNREPVKVTVVSKEGEVMWQKEKQHPSIKFTVPADNAYDITFEQQGSLTKTVHIDARNSVKPYTRKQTRKIDFEVIMEPQEVRDVKYANAVGTIDFSSQNGRMYVGTDYSLEKVEQPRKDRNDMAGDLSTRRN